MSKYNPEKTYSTVVIIGNGFDLNLGYKTSYNDFINSVQFSDLIDNNNNLCKHLVEKKELHTWVDIECELKKYSYDEYSSTDRRPFKLEYYALCGALCEYIHSIDLHAYNREAKLCKLATSVFNREDVLILDFNYTNSVYKILLETSEHTEVKCSIINVHGLAKDKTIIFGVEESARRHNDDIWLLKIVNREYKKINMDSILDGATHLFFVGFSLGESDHSYFKNFFHNHRCNSTRKERKAYFTFYTEDGRLDLKKQIYNITSGELMAFDNCFNTEYREIYPTEE